jgi:hypothetical protein
MTILFQGNRTIPAGQSESSVLPVPQNIKQPGQALQVQLSLVWDDFPTGTTAIDIFLSLDGGVTFPRSAGGTWVMPHEFRGMPPHFAVIGFSLGVNDNVTHAKYVTNAPAQFTTQVTITATLLNKWRSPKHSR